VRRGRRRAAPRGGAADPSSTSRSVMPLVSSHSRIARRICCYRDAVATVQGAQGLAIRRRQPDVQLRRHHTNHCIAGVTSVSSSTAFDSLFVDRVFVIGTVSVGPPRRASGRSGACRRGTPTALDPGVRGRAGRARRTVDNYLYKPWSLPRDVLLSWPDSRQGLAHESRHGIPLASITARDARTCYVPSRNLHKFLEMNTATA
jgi:hypothetical protein